MRVTWPARRPVSVSRPVIGDCGGMTDADDCALPRARRMVRGTWRQRLRLLPFRELSQPRPGRMGLLRAQTVGQLGRQAPSQDPPSSSPARTRQHPSIRSFTASCAALDTGAISC
jgi:hypothetical protein